MIGIFGGWGEILELSYEFHFLVFGSEWNGNFWLLYIQFQLDIFLGIFLRNSTTLKYVWFWYLFEHLAPACVLASLAAVFLDNYDV